MSLSRLIPFPILQQWQRRGAKLGVATPWRFRCSALSLNDTVRVGLGDGGEGGRGVKGEEMYVNGKAGGTKKECVKKECVCVLEK